MLSRIKVGLICSLIGVLTTTATTTTENVRKTSSSSAIEEVCKDVSFPQTCRDSLSAAAPNVSDPKTLMHTLDGLLIAELNKEMKYIEKTMKNATLEPGFKDFRPYGTCYSYMKLALYEIQENREIQTAYGNIVTCNDSLNDDETGQTLPYIEKDYYAQHIKHLLELTSIVKDKWKQMHIKPKPYQPVE